MAIDVLLKCSDCGSVTEKSLQSDEKEILCPECRRNMPNLPKEEFNQVQKTLSTQRLMGILSLVALGLAAGLLVLWVGQPGNWISTKDPKGEDTVMFLAGATVCALVGAALGFLSARKRYVVEF